MSEVNIQVQETVENVEIVANNNVIEVNITRQSGGGGGAVDSVNGQTGVVVLDATDVDALQRNGSNANSDVDLGAFSLNAKSFHAKGTNGSGHLGLRHQNSNPTATGQETVIFAGSDGEPRYKNAGGAIEQFASMAWVSAQGFITNIISALGYTPANKAGDTFTGNITAPNLSGTNTGDETITSIQTKRPLKTVASQSLEGSGNVALSKSDVGLGNVDNTSDLNKPISTAVQTALNAKISLNNWVDISLTSTIVGWSAFTTRSIEYLIVGNECTVRGQIAGTSNNATTSFTMPFNYTGADVFQTVSIPITNNGTAATAAGMARILANTSTVLFFTNGNVGAFTPSGTKIVTFYFTFKIN